VQIDAVDTDAATAGVDCVVDNGDDEREVFMALKEAAATLSPIVRNRLHGIPQYILEYSDLVVSNAVQRPFLKPILLAGPAAGDKMVLLQTLADEFPDVFAFPSVFTDEPVLPPADPGDSRCGAACCACGGWFRLSAHDTCLSSVARRCSIWANLAPVRIAPGREWTTSCASPSPKSLFTVAPVHATCAGPCRLDG